MLLKGKGLLTSVQKHTILAIGKLPDSVYFYLTGGTALAEFYFGHRKSYDLDIFTAESGLILPFTRLAEDHLRKSGLKVNVIRRFASLVEFEVLGKDERTRVQFALDSPFRFENPINSEYGILVNDYKDLIVDKLLAFFGRTEARDAIDLYFILKNNDIWNLCVLAKQKDPGFDLYWLAVAMQKIQEFPDDIGRWLVEMLAPVEIRDLKNLFSGIAKEILDKIKKKK